MKAEEVLRRYAANERDFRNLDLRGASFRGQTLTEANFSHADLRGTNFKGADLRGASFQGAVMGLELRWVIVSMILAGLLSLLVGIMAFGIGLWLAFVLSGVSRVSAIIAIVLALLSLLLILRLGRRFAIAPWHWLIAGSMAGALLGGLAGAVHLKVALTLALLGLGMGTLAGLGTVLITVAHLVTHRLSGPWLARGMVTIEIIVVVVMINHWRVASGWIILTALAMAIPGLYLSWRDRLADCLPRWVHQVIWLLIALGGTRFAQADLTDTDFTLASFQDQFSGKRSRGLGRRR